MQLTRCWGPNGVHFKTDWGRFEAHFPTCPWPTPTWTCRTFSRTDDLVLRKENSRDSQSQVHLLVAMQTDSSQGLTKRSGLRFLGLIMYTEDCQDSRKMTSKWQLSEMTSGVWQLPHNFILIAETAETHWGCATCQPELSPKPVVTVLLQGRADNLGFRSRQGTHKDTCVSTNPVVMDHKVRHWCPVCSVWTLRVCCYVIFFTFCFNRSLKTSINQWVPVYNYVFCEILLWVMLYLVSISLFFISIRGPSVGEVCGAELPRLPSGC